MSKSHFYYRKFQSLMRSAQQRVILKAESIFIKRVFEVFIFIPKQDNLGTSDLLLNTHKYSSKYTICEHRKLKD